MISDGTAHFCLTWGTFLLRQKMCGGGGGVRVEGEPVLGAPKEQLPVDRDDLLWEVLRQCHM